MLMEFGFKNEKSAFEKKVDNLAEFLQRDFADAYMPCAYRVEEDMNSRSTAGYRYGDFTHLLRKHLELSEEEINARFEVEGLPRCSVFYAPESENPEFELSKLIYSVLSDYWECRELAAWLATGAKPGARYPLWCEFPEGTEVTAKLYTRDGKVQDCRCLGLVFERVRDTQTLKVITIKAAVELP